MATVYFMELRKKYDEDILKVFDRLVDAAGGMQVVQKRSPTAVKLHIGESGNINYVNPRYVNRLVDLIGESGGRAFLTDTTTLYAGRRFRADLHIGLAREHGFDFAPMIIADGLYGDDYVDIDGAKVASLFGHIDSMLCVSHFKGHLNCGFGGALKNLGMGCSAKGGKLEMHSKSKPYVDDGRCTQCLTCFEYCIHDAIKKDKDKVRIDMKICTGCAGCMSVCPEGAIRFSWDAVSSELQKGIARYAASTVKEKKIFCLNFLINISPNCDCFHTNEPMITPDVGILASFDPVSIDQACYDLVSDAIDNLHPEIDPTEQLQFAERFGAGERKYELKSI
ncbi:MAG: DUF362 domain-containing protein [candidate division WOR-3 bacterium]|nr:MAG: DUF362 domain-containing protein [candidate division WOR-3 bacterium]